jgi:hypothetical protein
MTLLSAFGLFAVTAMLVTYALESKSAWFILAFAFASREHGHLGWSRVSGRELLCGVGGSKDSHRKLLVRGGKPLSWPNSVPNTVFVTMPRFSLRFLYELFSRFLCDLRWNNGEPRR